MFISYHPVIIGDIKDTICSSIVKKSVWIFETAMTGQGSNPGQNMVFVVWYTYV